MPKSRHAGQKSESCCRKATSAAWKTSKICSDKVQYISQKENWCKNIVPYLLVVIDVDEEGCREVIGAAEGMKEDKESWRSFLVWLKSRGLDGVKLVVGDKNLGMCESIHEVFPDAKYQRCTVHFYRNIMSSVPRNRIREVTYERGALSKRTSNQSFSIAKSDWEQSQLSLMLKAIHAQENKEAARKKAKEVVEKLKEMRLNAAAKKLEDGIEETLTYMDFPSQHWLKIRTNNVIERLNREIRRRTRVVGAFPDGNSALMLVCVRLRYVAGKDWECKKYLCMKYLDEAAE